MSERHRWADAIIAIAEGKDVQVNNGSSVGWCNYNDFCTFSPLHCPLNWQWRVKPKEKVKRWKWAYCSFDSGHMYECITDRFYTEDEFLKSPLFVDWAVKLEPTLKEFDE